MQETDDAGNGEIKEYRWKKRRMELRDKEWIYGG
jgi:hypothetical protein